MSKSVPRVLAILPGFIPSTLMDVVQPLLELDRANKIVFKTYLEPYTSLSEIERADVVVFCRNAEPKYGRILEFVLNHQVPYIYDLDDNLFEVPLDTELGRYHRAPQRLELLKRYIGQADLVRVYSKYTEQTIQQLGSSPEFVKAPLIWKYFRQPVGHHPSERIKIVYATSRKEDSLSQIFLPALQRVLVEYPAKVEVYFWGFFPKELKDLPNVYSLAPIQNYRKFINEFSTRGFDIGLAPLIDDQFHRSKTNNKFREYSACGIAGIYSNVDVYSECVKNAETGLLVSNEPEAWHSALVHLIEDKTLRQFIGANALAYSREHYSEEQFQNTWWQQILMVQSQTNNFHKPLKETSQSLIDEKQARESKTSGQINAIFDSFKSQSVKNLFYTIRLQLQNLWILFKLNQLKRL